MNMKQYNIKLYHFYKPKKRSDYTTKQGPLFKHLKKSIQNKTE